MLNPLRGGPHSQSARGFLMDKDDSTMKDPAFLFYSQDFLMGVADLTNEEVGQYVRMLCLQHQKGPLTAKIIKIQIGEVSKDVLDKFETDEHGNYYNTRLEQEVENRIKYKERQRENGLKGGRPKNPKETQTISQNKPKQNPTVNPNHKPNHKPNKSISSSSSSSSLSSSLSLSSISKDVGGKQVSATPISRFIIPSMESVQKEFFKNSQNEGYSKTAAQKFYNFYDSKGWMVGKNKMKKWEAAVRNWLNKDREEGRLPKAKEIRFWTEDGMKRLEGNDLIQHVKSGKKVYHGVDGKLVPFENIDEYINQNKIA